MVQNSEGMWTKTWDKVAGFELSDARGVTVTSILGDYYELPKIFLRDTSYSETQRDIGSFFFFCFFHC